MSEFNLNKNIIYFLSGEFVSQFGSILYGFAINLFILDLTGSPLYFSINIALTTLPVILFGPLAGIVSDKYNKKKIIVILEFFSAVVLTILFFSIEFERNILYFIYAITFIQATVGVFGNTIIESMIPFIVEKSEILKLNSISNIVMSSLYVIGILAGSKLYETVSLKYVVLFNALTYIIAGLIECQLQLHDHSADKELLIEKKKKRSLFIEFEEGISYINEKKTLKKMVLIMALVNVLVICGITIPTPYIYRNLMNCSAFEYGVISLAHPIGVMLGSYMAILFNKKNEFKRLIEINFFLYGGFIVVFSVILSQFSKMSILSTIYIFLIQIFMTIVLSIAQTKVNSSLQTSIPSHLIGRVQSLIATTMSILSPIAAIVGGGLVYKINPIILIALCGGMIILLSIALFFDKDVFNFTLLLEYKTES